ncbi:MAG: hypothetical protein ACLQU2_03005 [Candidatus Binataceae bacterium]
MRSEKELDLRSIEKEYTLRHFPGEPYRLLKPITVQVKCLGEDDFLASFSDADMAISGDSAQEAFQNLAAHILDVLEVFEQEESTLGPEPARQLAVLRDYIAHVG